MGPSIRVLAVLLWTLLLFIDPEPARGHAIVIESSPRSGEVVSRLPSAIVLRFNSRIESALSRVAVTGPGADSVPLTPATQAAGPDGLLVPLPSLEPGVYLVRWRVLSADGHVTQGVLRFTLAPDR